MASALERGFDVLLRSNGEALTLRRAAGGSVAVEAIVDRTPRASKERTPNFDPNRSSVIELKISAANPIAKKGDVFIDVYGVRHRVGEVTPRAFTVACECVKGWEA